MIAGLETRLDDLIEKAVRALFESPDISVRRLEPEDGAAEDHDIAASIGFMGKDIQGTILITTSMTVVARAWPRELRTRKPSQAETCDWAGELVNQLLGRVKNALVRFGVALEQGTPKVETGEPIHRALPSTNLARRYVFSVADEALLVYFDAVVLEGFALSDSEKPGTVEGDVFLF